MKSAVQVEGLDELEKKLAFLARMIVGAAVEMATEAGVGVALREARRRAPGPHVEATMVQSKRVGQVSYHIGPDKQHWYYMFFETGAGAHEIRAFRKAGKKALAFDVGDERVIVRGVKHPGIVSQPFLRPALSEHREQIKSAMGAVFEREILKAIR